MDNCDISIIVPIYKVEKYIKRCIDSLLAQTYRNYEIILVDDGSPDDCPQICDDYRKKYSFIKVIHKQNQGLGMARNSGLDIAIGKYIAFVDADDFVTPDMCEVLMSKATKYDADIVHSVFFKWELGNHKKKTDIDKDILYSSNKEISDFYLDMIAQSPEKNADTPVDVSVCSALYKRDIIEKNNIRFVSEREFISEDMVFNLDLYPCCSRIVVSSRHLYYYCYNGKSLSKSYKEERFEKDKELFSYIEERLKHLNIYDAVRTSRFLIARARYDMSLIVNSEHILGKQQTHLLLNNIVNDELLTKVVDSYPINKSRSLQKIFLVFLKKKRTSVLYVLCKLNNIKKRWD